MKDLYKKIKGKILLCLILVVIVIVIFFVVIKLTDENVLTIDEKTWIDSNSSTVLNINIINDSNIFGNEASGIYYDYLEDFSDKYSLTLNLITFKYETEPEGLTLGIFDEVAEDDVVFYTDHYVILSKNYEIVHNYSDLSDLTVGALKSTSDKIKSVYEGVVENYSTESELIKAFNTSEVEFIIVPRYIFADYIIENDYNVLYHLSDIEYYYALKTNDSELSSILKKYYNSIWNKEFYDSFKDNEFDLFVKALNLTESQTDKISSVDYKYGFVENSPYEVISSGSFGGVSAVLLSEFSDFINTAFEFVKFNNFTDLESAISNNEISVYYNKYNLENDYSITINGYNPEYSIIASRDNTIVVNSISGLKGKEVYVEDNTKIHDYLKTFNDINIVTYSTEKELFKLNNKDAIIILDSNSYEFYSMSNLNNYTSRFTFTTEFNNGYSVSSEDELFTVLNSYMNLTDENKLINEGINNHYKTLSLGNLLASLAKYILILLIVFLIVMIMLIQKSKKIQIAKKIKKDDKLKYIDQLTSLKNRNYFNDSKDSWDNNTIYPQAIILVDLNNIQKLNDQFGYKEGDKQIQMFANSLIRTQLDNSEIMRTDGNEFVIYLVGYGQKQIVNYIHKLNKEVEKLPYSEGAKFGYNIIESNLTTVEDALNEAANDMLEKNKNEEKNKKNN